VPLAYEVLLLEIHDQHLLVLAPNKYYWTVSEVSGGDVCITANAKTRDQAQQFGFQANADHSWVCGPRTVNPVPSKNVVFTRELKRA